MSKQDYNSIQESCLSVILNPCLMVMYKKLGELKRHDIQVRASYFTLRRTSFQVTKYLKDITATLLSETMAPSLLNNGAAFKAFLRTKGGSDEAAGYFVDSIGIKTIVQMARLTKESWAYSTKKLEDPDQVLIPATPAR